MALTGEFAALATGVCWACGATLFTTAGRRMGSVVLNRHRLTIASFLLGATLLVLRGSPWPLWANWTQVGLLALSGLIGFVFGDTFSFRSQIILGAGPATLLASLAPIFTALLAWPILGETLGPRAILGIALTLGGLAWVMQGLTKAEHFHGEGSHSVGVVAGVLAGLGQAGGFIFSKMALKSGLDPLSATVIRVMTAAVVMWAMALVRSEIRPGLATLRDGTATRAMLAGSVFGPFLGVTLSLVALQHTKAGVAASIIAFYPILTIFLAARFHQVKITPQMLLGALVAVSGVVVLFLR